MTRGAALDNEFGHRFANAALRVQALTHRSFGVPNNERLEFLGDALLNCIVASELYARFPNLAEGELSRVRASLVREPTLAEIAHELGLRDHLQLGEGEARSGGRDRTSILADALEALLGAAYLDGGFDAARAVVTHLWGTRLIAGDSSAAAGKDAKTALQEWLQGKRWELPRYEVVTTRGAAHSQTFEVACLIAALGLRVTAEGSSRRMAEQAAARRALELIEAPVGAGTSS